MKALVLSALALGTVLAFDLGADPSDSLTNQPIFRLTNAVPTHPGFCPPNTLALHPGLSVTNTLALPTNSLFSAELPPGVYETRPFTCIVVVPGRHLDEKMIIGGNGDGQLSMPMKSPELQFIPHHKGK